MAGPIVERMSEDRPEAAEPDVMDMFDESGAALVCRVCGSLVSGDGDYRRAHWDWHEASNGA